MAKLAHWTEESTERFLYRITSDYVLQLERFMEEEPTSQSRLASRLGVTEGRVSQVLNKPGNLTLKKVVQYARALGKKVAIVAYDDGDVNNQNGPINAEIFASCWHKCGEPIDFFALSSLTAWNAPTNQLRVRGGMTSSNNNEPDIRDVPLTDKSTFNPTTRIPWPNQPPSYLSIQR